MRVLALDPGLMTGVAVIGWDGKTPVPTPDALVHTGEVPYDEMPEWFDRWIVRVNVVAMERFVISIQTVKYSRQPEPLYVIGGVMFLSALRQVPVKLQDKAAAKSAYTNARLKELGWYVKGEHARDAVRHALLATHTPLLYTL